MSLLRQLQQITERTYQQGSGVNFEHFVVGPRQFRDLTEASGSITNQLSDMARTFLRVKDNRLYLAIYYSRPMIEVLERYDPRRGLHKKNIHAFTIFIEELNHAIHAALKFLTGDRDISDEHFLRDLELLAKIDCYHTLKYFMAYFNSSKQLEEWDRLWIRHHTFEGWDFGYDSPKLRSRYRETNLLGEKYTRFLEGLPPEHRVKEIRRFRGMGYPQKRQYIRFLPN